MDYRSAARTAAQIGDVGAAVDAFSQLLTQKPDDVEALAFLATMALRGRQYREAELLFSRALREAPDDLALRENFGIALQLSGKQEVAQEILSGVLEAKPEFYVARLFLARSIEAQHGARRALGLYARSVREAQAGGRWISNETTPAWMSAFVREAVARVNTVRADLLGALLKPLNDRYGADELRRVNRFVGELLGPPTVRPESALQRPKQHYIPGLPEVPFIERKWFPWIEEAETLTESIREEFTRAFAGRSEFRPFMDLRSPEDAELFLRSRSAQPARWDAYFFYRHGQRDAAHLGDCPAVAKLLNVAPIPRIDGFAPEVCFSLLTPGTHILPHTGDTNLRCVFHLPLVVPQDCALQVAGQRHEWQEGCGVVFDDTFEHEAWNFSDRDRVVLIADVWNPHLSVAEQEALSLVVPLWGRLVEEASA